MINQNDPAGRDVTEIFFRTFEGKEFKIPVFSMSRAEAINIYETIWKQKEVTFACAFVKGGNRI
jgi:hypothetical protein